MVDRVAALRSKKAPAIGSQLAGGYGIRPYVFRFGPGPKLHIFYYLLSIIFYLFLFYRFPLR